MSQSYQGHYLTIVTTYGNIVVFFPNWWRDYNANNVYITDEADDKKYQTILGLGYSAY